mmetsp:Transcript_46424/g.105342  ORF Transcript_46424/g.105342 Transcript_46424/m.105342 type:complete len:372 (-) Transcript_46424:443-1558(-)
MMGNCSYPTATCWMNHITVLSSPAVWSSPSTTNITSRGELSLNTIRSASTPNSSLISFGNMSKRPRVWPPFLSMVASCRAAKRSTRVSPAARRRAQSWRTIWRVATDFPEPAGPTKHSRLPMSSCTLAITATMSSTTIGGGLFLGAMATYPRNRPGASWTSAWQIRGPPTKSTRTSRFSRRRWAHVVSVSISTLMKLHRRRSGAASGSWSPSSSTAFSVSTFLIICKMLTFSSSSSPTIPVLLRSSQERAGVTSLLLRLGIMGGSLFLGVCPLRDSSSATISSPEKESKLDTCRMVPCRAILGIDITPTTLTVVCLTAIAWGRTSKVTPRGSNCRVMEFSVVAMMLCPSARKTSPVVTQPVPLTRRLENAT